MKQHMSIEQKTQVVLEIISGDTTSKRVAQEFEIEEHEIENWCSLYIAALKKSNKEGVNRKWAMPSQGTFRKLIRPAMVAVSCMVVLFVAFEAMSETPIGCKEATPGNLQLCLFSASKPAVASEVNSNFTKLAAWIVQKVGPVGNSDVTILGSANISGETNIGGETTITDALNISGQLTTEGRILARGIDLVASGADADGYSQVIVYALNSSGSDSAGRFNSILSESGGAITYVGGEPTGDTFTINVKGLYSIYIRVQGDYNSCPTNSMTVAKNTTTKPSNYGDENILLEMGHHDSLSYSTIVGSNLVFLNQGDVVRTFPTGCSGMRFEIKRVR